MWNSRDGGATWNDLTLGLTTIGMPGWGMVSKIEPSHHDAGTAYIAVARHLMDDREPYIYKTADFGKSWKRVSGDLPSKSPLSYVRAVAESPARKGLLYAGTGNGFYYSLDDGAHWNQLQTNTVRLTAGGKTETQLLDVLRDRRRGRGRSEVSSGIANVDDPKSRQAKPTWTNRSLVRERGRGRTASRLRT